MPSDMILRPQTFDQLNVFATMAAKSTMVPVPYRNKPEDIMLAVQMGSEVGLAPMQALQNIAVINGRPSLWGDAMLALCKQHPAWGGVKETVDGDGDAMRAVCEVHRKGDQPVISVFSVADAKKAGLWGKQGPWQSYPQRMLQMRARGFALRDAFPDALRGLISAEEAADIPADNFKGMTIDARAEPPPSAPADADPRATFNAAHPMPPEPVNTAPPEKDTADDVPEKVRVWIDQHIAALQAAPDAPAYFALVDHADTRRRMDYLRQDYPALAKKIEDAGKAAFAALKKSDEAIS